MIVCAYDAPQWRWSAPLLSGSTVQGEVFRGTAKLSSLEWYDFIVYGIHDPYGYSWHYQLRSTDPKDQYSLGNRADAEKKQEKEEKAAEHAERVPATRLAESHGNEPSRGAKIDEELAQEDQAELERKNKA